GRPVVAGTQRDAAELSFYLAGQPEVIVFSGGSRPAAADYFDGGPDLAAIPSVAYVGKHAELFCERYDFDPAPADPATPRAIKVQLFTGRPRARPFAILEHKAAPVASRTPATRPAANELPGHP